MGQGLLVRLRTELGSRDLPVRLLRAGSRAADDFYQHRWDPGIRLLLQGDRDYCVALCEPTPETVALVRAAVGQRVLVQFAERKPVRRLLRAVAGAGLEQPGEDKATAALDLTAGIRGAPPLFLLPDGRLSQTPDQAPTGMDLLPVLVAAARWVSSRRTTTFEKLFPDSAFHPEEPSRPERLSPQGAEGMLAQLREALVAAAPDGAIAAVRPDEAAQLRSAALTILSHIVATVRKDPDFRQVADAAAAEIFQLIERERGPQARPALRAHAIRLLQLRAPALRPEDQERAVALLRALVRQAPPYDELTGPWRFAMCSAYEFYEGECEILRDRYHFREVPTPQEAPRPPGGVAYRVLEAPFVGPAGQPIFVFARPAWPANENHEMGEEYFIGVLISRHAQLGAFDMQASASSVRQVGYKLMMNTQCAGLTTRFAISKMFPDADIYSSWDSTYFRTGRNGKVVASEGLDCFVALLQGMSQGEGHREISARMERAQWFHPQARFAGFVQFVGPAHPQVVGRFSDVNQDGRADFYDGFLDLFIKDIAVDLQNSATPRDPGVPASQVGGAAARGLGWAAGSLNRVTQYSDLWESLPGGAELLYPFQAGGFYSHKEPPRDVPLGQVPPEVADLGRLPAVCRFVVGEGTAGLTVDVMFHSYLSHAAEELKRLLCAAEAMRRALDLGLLSAQGPLSSPLQQRGAILLMLAGLLEFPADQNFVDGLWSMALSMLNFPPISRTLIRSCITHEDHQASNYYGSVRGLRQLVGDGDTEGALQRADPVAYEKLRSDDPLIGRARPLELPD
ncbi:MAG: hypothetical protein RMK29_06410 [Myxococcales bacterium]|nr:hypothetical protein [Myxococcota bacterium]MDW8281325.1 hypothetical protein [Myxococcales bacterium]